MNNAADCVRKLLAERLMRPDAREGDFLDVSAGWSAGMLRMIGARFCFIVLILLTGCWVTSHAMRVLPLEVDPWMTRGRVA